MNMDYEVANWKQRRREKTRLVQLLDNQNDLFWDLIAMKRPRMNDMDWKLYFCNSYFFLTLWGIAMLTYDD